MATNVELAPSLPPEIDTGCPELDLVWRRFSSAILDRPGVLIADTDEDLTWHAFLGHSIDMQGFRAAEFAGVDELTRSAPRFISLRQRGIGVSELASLRDVPAIRDHLRSNLRGIPLSATLDVLRSTGGEVGVSLAEAFQWFPWRKFHWAVRALLENSAVLADHEFSFRRWLEAACIDTGASEFPPSDFQQAVVVDGSGMTLERAIRKRLQTTFYQVGPALAPYMICDWQLWLWKHGMTRVFATFKLDSFHEQFVFRHGRGVIPATEDGFTEWWWGMYPELPPRLPNECIWLGIEQNVV